MTNTFPFQKENRNRRQQAGRSELKGRAEKYELRYAKPSALQPPLRFSSARLLFRT